MQTHGLPLCLCDMTHDCRMQNKSGKAPGTRAGPVMVAVDSGLLMFGGVGGSGVPFAQECWLLQLGPNPLLGLKDNEVCAAQATLMQTFIVCTDAASQQRQQCHGI